METSPLSRLPGELRNLIWRFSLLAPGSADVTHKRLAGKPGLLRTCRQIRRETWSVYWGENTFLLRMTGVQVIHSAWLRAIGRFCASAIRCFQLAHDADCYSLALSDADFATAVQERWQGRSPVSMASEQHVRRLMAELGRYGNRVEVMQMLETDCRDRYCGTMWVGAKMQFEMLALEAKAKARLDAELDAQLAAMFAALRIC